MRSFSSVTLGLPKHIKDDDVHCEMPLDVDDEYISESGFQPVLPGESTKVSSALALFKAASILSRVLEEVFPAKVSYELSLKKLSDLSDELELWEASLPSHLRLHFAQDKPSTGTVTSRSPILSLVYHYIRALIQRPAIIAPLGNRTSSAMLVHANSCKRIVQIVQLLEERGLTLAFCFNKDEVLVLAGVGLLFQRLQLEPSSKILKDNQRSVVAIVDVLTRKHALVADTFRGLVQQFLPCLDIVNTTEHKPSKHSSKPSISRTSSDRVTLAEQSTNLQSSARRHLKAIASRFSATANGKIPTLATTPSFSAINGAARQSQSPVLRSQPSHSPTFLAHATPTTSLSPASRRSRPVSIDLQAAERPSLTEDKISNKHNKRQTMPPLNLDYLSFGTELDQSGKTDGKSSKPIKTEPQPTDWERLLGNLDNGTTNIFDACYGGPPIEALSDTPPSHIDSRPALAVHDAALAWNTGLRSSPHPTKCSPAAASSSLFSFSSDEGIVSNDELSNTDWSSADSHTNDKSDALNALVLSDFAKEFDFDIAPDWQETLSGVD